MISSSCIVLSSNYFIISLYDFRSVTLTLALFSHMTTWLYPRRTLGPILIPKYVVPFLVFILVRTNHDDFLKMGKYSGQCDCVAKTFCKEHVFLMILSKWESIRDGMIVLQKTFCKEHVFLIILSKLGYVRAAVRVLQKCNRLWPLSKCSAVKTTFRHKSDEKGENEKFCPKTFSFQAKYFRAGEERNSLIHENKKFWWSGWIVCNWEIAMIRLLPFEKQNITMSKEKKKNEQCGEWSKVETEAPFMSLARSPSIL